ncbi:undecaprenyl-phosphate galactose phosphotransferase WbaP [Desulfotomaculum sp. 1211_IL3151]|uniref:undecaprenyl-phosphate galactose phosphotransferase WbaP n=1 Tax=Desulfotomaculum sp. 1211_IL3151 TaxID=3084055 RepID=UPI002FDB7591
MHGVPQREATKFLKTGRAGEIKKKFSVGVRTKNLFAILLILGSDLIILYLSLILAYFTRLYVLPQVHLAFQSTITPESLLNIWWFPLLCVIVLAREGLYHGRKPFWQEIQAIIRGITWAIFFTIFVIFINKSANVNSRPLILMTYVYLVIIFPIIRMFFKKLLVKIGLWKKPIIILGTRKAAHLISSALSRESNMGFYPMGLLEYNNQKEKGTSDSNHDIPVLGKFADATEVLKRTNVKDVIIVAPDMDDLELVDLTNKLQKCANVMLIPSLVGLPLTSIKIGYFFNEKTLILSINNNLASVSNRIFKRIFDLSVSLLLLPIILPILGVIALAIRVDSKGPVIFAQKRVGHGGKTFNCFKFRTMIMDAQKVLENILDSDPQTRKEWEADFKLKNDPRITRVGKFLRRTSLDEFPQLLNVMLGQMSFVGPRPIIEDEIEKYGSYFQDFTMVLPGITGLWQVSGRNDVSYDERVQLDIWYVRNWSLWLDIEILLRTVSVVLNGKGAY